MGIDFTDNDTVAMYDTTTDTAFGPLFESKEEGQYFLEFLDYSGYEDARSLPNIHTAYGEFKVAYEKFEKQSDEPNFFDFLEKLDDEALAAEIASDE